MMMIGIANAPVSYGAFEVTVGHDEDVPTAVDVLDSVRAAGYAGIDLGPLGYLGLDTDLREALASRTLLLAGGYVEIDVSSDEAPSKGFSELQQVCDQFDVVAQGVEPVLLPRPTVAIVAAQPRSGSESESTWWARVQRTIDAVVDQCDKRGYEACLHNEVGTQIATQESIVRALASTAISLCLDSGHLVAAGGDPLTILQDWRQRVGHVHLKDVRMDALDPPYEDAMALWEGNVFCKLGVGNGRVDAILDSLRTGGYSGWIVVEQDVLPRAKSAYARARNDQFENRKYLLDRGW
jgi:inosose dehydratase